MATSRRSSSADYTTKCAVPKPDNDSCIVEADGLVEGAAAAAAAEEAAPHGGGPPAAAAAAAAAGGKGQEA